MPGTGVVYAVRDSHAIGARRRLDHGASLPHPLAIETGDLERMPRVLWPILASLVIVTACSNEEAGRPADTAPAVGTIAAAYSDPAAAVNAIADAYVEALFERFPESDTLILPFSIDNSIGS